MAKNKDGKVATTAKTAAKLVSSVRKPSITPKAGPKSEAFVDDSDEGLESDDEEPAQRPHTSAVAKSKVNGVTKSSAKTVVSKNGVKATTAQQESDSASSSEESEDESTDDEESGAISTKAAANPGDTATSSADDASSGEESSEEDTDDEAEFLKTTDATSAQPLRRAAEVYASEPRPVKPFKPSSGFKAVTQDDPSSTISEIQSSTENGLQLWHITAPSDVPLKSIKALTLEKINNGESVISHRNINYAFNTTKSFTGTPPQILLPSTDGYKPISTHFSRQLQLQQVIQLDAYTSPRPQSAKRKREQPKGLKQRFQPIGVVGEPARLAEDESQGEDAEQAPPEFRAPPDLPNGDGLALQQKEKKKKRKHDETEEERAARKAAKKAKKEAKAAALSAGNKAMDATEVKVKKKKKNKQDVEIG